MTIKKIDNDFKSNASDLKQALELAKSVIDTSSAIAALIPQNAVSQMLDSLAVKQALRMQVDVQILMKSISPTFGLLEAFAKQRTEVIESIMPQLKLGGIYESQINTLASLAKMSFPSFNFPKRIRQSQEFVHQNLKKELKNLNEDYFNMWDGSWKALNSDNPDKIRQSANSMRELFRMLIHSYSDNEQIRAENSLKKKQTITRKQRLSFILKNTGATKEQIEHLDSNISLTLDADERIQKATHAGGKEEDFRILLHIYEGYIWMIVKQVAS